MTDREWADIPVEPGRRMAEYGRRLVRVLEGNTVGLSSADLKTLLGPEGDVPYIPILVKHVRMAAGSEEILTCQYVPHYLNARGTLGAWVYRLASSAPETYTYVNQRKVKVRNECHNLVVILGKAEARWPADMEIKMAKAMLQSVVNLLSVE